MTTLDLAIKAEAAVLERLSLSEQIEHIENTLSRAIAQPGLRRWLNAKNDALKAEAERIAA